MIKGLSYLEPNCVGGNSKHVFYVRYYFLGAFLKKNLTSHRSNMMHQCKIMKSFLIVQKRLRKFSVHTHLSWNTSTHTITQSYNRFLLNIYKCFPMFSSIEFHKAIYKDRKAVKTNDESFY